MRRPVALLALTALSWSQLVGLRCDMGGPASESDTARKTAATAHHAPARPMAAAHHMPPAPMVATHHAAPAPTAAAHHHPPTGGGPPPPHGGHGNDDACLMVLACGSASARPAARTAMVRVLDIVLRTDFSASGHPVAVDAAVDTPPPRLTV